MTNQNDESKILIKMRSQTCKPRPSEKVHGLITMDKFKTTCLKWLKGFFDTYPKWVSFTKISSKKN